VLLKLFLLFTLLPLVELTLLLVLGDVTDRWWIPVLIVVVSGVAGALLARRQGFQTFRRIQEGLSQGHLPTQSLLDAVLIFFAGALLLTPGLLTDLLGISLLIPPCRKFYKTRLITWFKNHFQLQAASSETDFTPGRSTVIDSYVVDRSESTDDETQES